MRLPRSSGVILTSPPFDMAIGAWGFCPYLYKADRNSVTKKNVLNQAKVSKLPFVFWLIEIVFLVIVISPPLISRVLSGV